MELRLKAKTAISAVRTFWFRYVIVKVKDSNFVPWVSTVCDGKTIGIRSVLTEDI